MTERRKLPTERSGITHRFVIRAREKGAEDNKGYITVGLYEDGTPGEIFVKMDRQGSQVSGFVDAWAISISFLLQMGMSLDEIVSKFKGSRFEPAGLTDNPNIQFASSPIDYVVRWLEGRFIDAEQWAPSTTEAEQVPCDKCGRSDRPRRLSRGRMLCDPCAGGLAPERAAP